MKKKLFFLLSVFTMHFLSFMLLAQEKPVIEKKYFKRQDGKIFWQEKLPVYIQISDKADMKNPLILEDVMTKEMKKVSNPFYWDGPGTHFIRHLDYMGADAEHQVAYTVYVDGIAPISSIKLINAPVYFTKNKRYYGKNLKLFLSSKDELSGVDKLYVSVNNTDFSEYSKEINLNKEGDNIIKYFAVDSTGNEENVKEKEFIIDLTAPETNYQFEKDFVDNILSPRTLIKLSATDNLSGVSKIYYQIDSLPKKQYVSYISLANVPDGNHQLKYFSVDNVKNEEIPKTVDFYLDKIPPVVKSDFSGDFYEVNGRVYLAGDAKISLSATDNKSGVKEINYSISNGKSKIYTEPFILSPTKGAYNVKMRAIDNVNNKKPLYSALSTDENLNNLYLDNIAPKISHTYIGKKFYTRDTMFITSATKIKLNLIDYESGGLEIKYSLDNNVEQQYKNEFIVEKEGLHNIKYTGFDNVKNSKSDSFFFIIDNSGPKVFYHMSLEAIGTQKLKSTSKEIPIYAVNTRLYLAATDKLVGTKVILYSINGKAEKLYSTPIKLTQTGLYKLKIKAIDKLDNITDSEEYSFVVQ